MKICSFLLGLGLLCGVAAPISSVGAQPATAPVATNEVRVSLSKDGVLVLNVDFGNVEKLKVVEAIANAGNLDIAVYGSIKGSIPRFSTSASPGEALARFCEAANLICIKQEGVWIVGEPPVAKANAPKSLEIELEFRDVSAVWLMKQIGEQFELKIEVDEAVSEKQTLTLAIVKLSDMTAQQALERIADAANLQLTREGETFVVKPRPIGP